MKKQTKVELNKVPFFSPNGKKMDTLELNKDVFTGKVNEALLYQAVRMYRANTRRGTASTKTRGDVRGGGKKPWKQKGTGRARFGSIRNPLWRGGGIAFGPHPRDFSYTLPKKIRRKAFLSSLNAKLKDGELLVIEEIVLENSKTKNIVKLLKGLKVPAKVLFLVANFPKDLYLAARNIKKVTVKKINDATALDVLSNDHVVIVKEALGMFKGKDEK